MVREGINALEERFFEQNLPDNPELKFILDLLHRQNKRQAFVDRTVGQISYPRWDKALLQPTAAASRSSSVGERILDTSLVGYSTGPVSIGTDSTVDYTVQLHAMEFLVGDLHTHPATCYAAHSPAYVYQVLESFVPDPHHFEDSFVKAANGAQYALSVTDTLLAWNFLATKGDFWRGQVGGKIRISRKISIRVTHISISRPTKTML